jgi:hypothetical protein
MMIHDFRHTRVRAIECYWTCLLKRVSTYWPYGAIIPFRQPHGD